jgi:hypothetical protein
MKKETKKKKIEITYVESSNSDIREAGVKQPVYKK